MDVDLMTIRPAAFQPRRDGEEAQWRHGCFDLQRYIKEARPASLFAARAMPFCDTHQHSLH